MRILAFESSCDETSVAIVSDNKILSNIISSQYFHSKYGGVVPELASRAHLKIIYQLTQMALEEAKLEIEEIDAFAVTTEPGLIGSLIVGSNFAKGLALKYNKPIVPVNHIEGHIFSGMINNDACEFPFINLVVSGGHTAIFLVKSFEEYSIIGLTRDDAAGEAFDKIAKLMGLEYPGGPLIDKLSKQGDPKKFNFPRSMMHSPDYDFSFSGLKTSVRYFIQKEFPDGLPAVVMPDMAASVQSAIVDVLVHKSLSAAREYKVKHIVVSGGVSANSQLREQMQTEAKASGFEAFAPSMGFCMDNAAMIGFIAEKKLLNQTKNDFRCLTFRVNASSLRSQRNSPGKFGFHY